MVGAADAIVVVLGLFATVLAPSTTVIGTVTYYASNYLTVGTSCEGNGLYNFLTRGGAVSVYDETGVLVGTGYLGSGAVRSAGSSSYGYGNACVFTYSVSDVASSDYYRVKVGSSSSDSGVPFSADQVNGHADIRFGTY